jgi:hypothetical protein
MISIIATKPSCKYMMLHITEPFFSRGVSMLLERGKELVLCFLPLERKLPTLFLYESSNLHVSDRKFSQYRL